VSLTESTTEQAPAGSRWIGVGSSNDPNAVEAGRAGAAEALQGDDPRLVVAFCADSYDLEALVGGIHERTRGAVPLIGCSTAGEISTVGPGTASVVVTAFGGDFDVSTGVGVGASRDLRGAGASAASCVSEIGDRRHKVVMMLTDGLAGDQQEIVRGAYAEVGAAVPLVGGCAADDLNMRATHQLYGDHVLQDGVVAAAIGSDGPVGIGVRHGWRKVGEPMLVTASESNRVHRLDGRPALDVYLERLDAPPEATSDSGVFTRFAMTHPLGLDRRSGEEVRFVSGADLEERTLTCIADVPQGALTWIMAGDEGSVLDATDAACDEALAALEPDPPLGVLAFDCIARRGVLGDEGIHSEVKRVAAHANGAQVAGFYTYGEIARVRGTTGFHNQTLVILAVA
jgi:hypothetical protein